jgi:hypothetical protein
LSGKPQTGHGTDMRIIGKYGRSDDLMDIRDH